MNKIAEKIRETIENGGNIYCATDWHMVKQGVGADYDAIIKKHRNTVTSKDMFIYLGDIVDDIMYAVHRDRFTAIVEGMGNCYKVLVRGNNDILSDSEYLEMGFDAVVYSFVYNGIVFSHTSIDVYRLNKKLFGPGGVMVQMNEGWDADLGKYKIRGNIHGHIHRDGTDCDSIPYYHKCDKNVNVCRFGTDSVNVADIIARFDELALKNTDYNTDLDEKPFTKSVQGLAEQEVIGDMMEEFIYDTMALCKW